MTLFPEFLFKVETIVCRENLKPRFKCKSLSLQDSILQRQVFFKDNSSTNWFSQLINKTYCTSIKPVYDWYQNTNIKHFLLSQSIITGSLQWSWGPHSLLCYYFVLIGIFTGQRQDIGLELYIYFEKYTTNKKVLE